MKILVFLSCLLIFSSTALANEKVIYVSRDANGVMVFSDSPSPGAEEFKLSSHRNIVAATAVEFPERKAAPAEEFTISIVQPQPEETVRDNTGSVYINGNVSPRFQRGHQIQLLFNGKPHGQPQRKALFVLRELDRGEHNIQLELLDQNGKLIATSPVTTFYLHRASLISPN